jgi:hypothetical protein
MLQQNGYTLNSQLVDATLLLPGDVIVWANSEEKLVHTCYFLGDGFAFNKDGQSMFNPWSFRYFDHVFENWSNVLLNGGTVNIYRKCTLS